jgi:hypothetical protein
MSSKTARTCGDASAYSIGGGVGIGEAPAPFVMAGLVPAIHVLNNRPNQKTWMPGIKPGMTFLVRAGDFHAQDP